MAHTTTVPIRISELVVPATLDAPPDKRLSAWVVRYWQEEVAGGPTTPQQAKRRDLQLFLDYFARTLRSDLLDDWTRSISRGFVRWLETEGKQGTAYAATSVNRTLATVRRFAKFVQERGGFRYGFPLDGVSELNVDEPAWKGLTDVQVTRLRAAVDQLEKLKDRRNQMPLRNRAILLVLLGTALRVSELLRLDLADYRGKHFHDVKRKGRNRTKKLYVPKEAKEALDEYVARERGQEAGPLFVSRTGERLARQHVDRLLKEIAAQANAKLPPDERICLHAHKLRHTVLARAANKFGVHYAKELSGHVSDRHIWRYVQPSDEEKESAQEALL